MNAIISAVTTRPTFYKRIVERSTTIVFNKVASVSKRDESIEVVFLVSSNQPISFFKITAVRWTKEIKEHRDNQELAFLLLPLQYLSVK